MGGVERGERNLTIQSVMTIAKGLGISMSELLSGIEKQVEPQKGRDGN
jgi:transcriptional regulator with XRE-family HTH domain